MMMINYCCWYNNDDFIMNKETEQETNIKW